MGEKQETGGRWLPIEKATAAKESGERIIVASFDGVAGHWRVFTARWCNNLLPGQHGWLHGGIIEHPTVFWTEPLPLPPHSRAAHPMPDAGKKLIGGSHGR